MYPGTCCGPWDWHNEKGEFPDAARPAVKVSSLAREGKGRGGRGNAKKLHNFKLKIQSLRETRERVEIIPEAAATSKPAVPVLEAFRRTWRATAWLALASAQSFGSVFFQQEQQQWQHPHGLALREEEGGVAPRGSLLSQSARLKSHNSRMGLILCCRERESSPRTCFYFSEDGGKAVWPYMRRRAI